MARIDRTRSKITKLLENLETGDVFNLVMIADMALSLASIADSLTGDEVESNATSSGSEESIPVSWIEKEIWFLKSQDNEFAGLAASNISGMLNKWRDEQNERD